jgi:SWI/SNF-related matrix-associated actin-dependent regulator 1 of chromatin subfamily A
MKQQIKVIPDGLSLFPYQTEGVKQLLTRKRTLLADVPGLGKTPQAIVFTNCRQPQYVVVVCPASLRTNWLMEFNRWTTYLAPQHIQVIDSAKTRISPEAKVLICSYAYIAKPVNSKKLIEFLSSPKHLPLALRPSSMLILDEAHAVKNYKSKCTKSAFELASHVDYVLPMTGTPVTRSLEDVHPLWKLSAPDTCPRKKEFCDKFMYSIPSQWGSGTTYVGAKNTQILKKQLAAWMVRRFKKDVAKELPPKTIHHIYLETSSQTEKIAKQMEDSPEGAALIENILSTGNYPTPSATAHLFTQRRLFNLSKLPSIKAYLSTYLESTWVYDHRPASLVVFAYHKEMVTELIDFFRAISPLQQRETTFPLTVEAITGETPATKRQAIVDRFQNKSTQVLVCNIHAAGVGLTLTAASTAIVTELDWSPAIMEQAHDRLHRVTQSSPVNIYWLLSKTKLDTRVASILKSKIKLIDNVVGGEGVTGETEEEDSFAKDTTPTLTTKMDLLTPLEPTSMQKALGAIEYK